MAKINALNDFSHDPKLGLYTRTVVVHGYELLEAKENSLSHDVKIISIARDGEEFSLNQPVTPSRLCRNLLEKEGEVCGVVYHIKRPTSTGGKIIGIGKPGEDFFPDYHLFNEFHSLIGISTEGMEKVVDSVELNQEVQFWSKDSSGALFQFFTTGLGKSKEGDPIFRDHKKCSVYILWGWKGGRKIIKQILIR